MKPLLVASLLLLSFVPARGFAQQSSLPVQLQQQFANEPSVEDAIEAALEQYGVEADDIEGLRRRAATSALMPEVDVSYRTNSSELDLDRFDYIQFPDRQAAEDLGAGEVTELQVSAGWDFGDVVFNPNAVEVYGLVPLHRDIAEQVIDAYFLRRRLLIALAMNPPTDETARLMTEMRLEAATARLNQLTDGLFD